MITKITIGDFVKRLSIVLGFQIILAISFITIVQYLEIKPEYEYKYLDLNNEYGISDKCYVENQVTICKINNEIAKVKQFERCNKKCI